jgi:hypothetical protein
MAAPAHQDSDKGSCLRTWLFNPFHFVAGGAALLAGLAVILGTGLVASLSRSHFDGVLDFHIGAEARLWLFVLEGPIDWLALAIPLWICGLLISKSLSRLWRWWAP